MTNKQRKTGMIKSLISRLYEDDYSRFCYGQFALRERGTDTYSLTPYSTVLLENLTGSQPVKKFPPFHGTRRFITAFTSARHLSLS